MLCLGCSSPTELSADAYKRVNLLWGRISGALDDVSAKKMLVKPLAAGMAH